MAVHIEQFEGLEQSNGGCKQAAHRSKHIFKFYSKLKDCLRNLNSQFQCSDIVHKFEDKEKTYKIWCRPLWDWIMDHLIDPELIRHFEWDTQKVFRVKDGIYKQIFTELWTGKRF